LRGVSGEFTSGRPACARALVAAVVVAAALATLPGAARAASGVSVSTGSSSGPGRVVSTPSINITVSGAITFTWMAEPTQACAAEGLCGVSGAIEAIPNISYGEAGSGLSPRTIPIEVSDTNAVVRVSEPGGPSGTPVSCVDVSPADFSFRIIHAGGRTLARLSASDSSQLPGAGRCAGPIGRDFGGLELPARRFGRYSYDLTGRASVTAGPFLLTALSTLRANITTSRNGGSGSTVIGGGGGSPRRIRFHHAFAESATAVYRLSSTSGALATTFAGLGSPLCDPLAACGSSGTIKQTLAGSGTISFSASRIVAHRVGRAAALADLAAGRLGTLGLVSRARLGLATTERLTRADGSACQDAVTAPLALATSSVSPGDRSVVQLTTDTSFGLVGGRGFSDPLRTRCPGPSLADVGGRLFGPFASTPATRIGGPTVTLAFARDRAFTGSAYAGRVTGAVVLSLVRTRVTAGSRPVSVPIGVRSAR
jgi:hypothetical protein